MANSTAGKIWELDTAGVIVDSPVYIKNVQVTWKVASAGEVELTEFDREAGAGITVVYGKTLGATSAAIDQMTQIFPIENWVAGLNLKTVTDVDKLLVVTK